MRRRCWRRALRGGNSLSPAARPAFGRAGRELHDLLPYLGGALQIALAEREHDAFVEQRLGVLRIDAQREFELLERSSVRPE